MAASKIAITIDDKILSRFDLLVQCKPHRFLYVAGPAEFSSSEIFCLSSSGSGALRFSR